MLLAYWNFEYFLDSRKKFMENNLSKSNYDTIFEVLESKQWKVKLLSIWTD